MDFRYFLKGMLMPPFSQIILLLVAWKIRHHALKTSKFLCFIALLSLWLLASPVIANFLAQTLEQDPPLFPRQLTNIQAQAIVVLSASQNDYAPEFGEPVSEPEQLIRIRYGAFLQKKTGLPVLLSGGSVSGNERRILAETMAYDLVSAFEGRVGWLEKESRTTAENARNSYNILAQENKTTIILVTSSMHMLRAKWSFENVGFKVLAAPTHFIDRTPLSLNSFVPNARALQLSSEVLHEWLGLLVYKFLALMNSKTIIQLI